jgi:hypothetical protein
LKTQSLVLGAALAVSFLSFSESHAACAPADPAQSEIEIGPSTVDCHYVFYPDGSRDRIRASVTLRDDAGNPISGAVVEMRVADRTGTLDVCEGFQIVTGVTNAEGHVALSVGELCGCGTFGVGLAAFCPQDPVTVRPLGHFGPFQATSPDLNGSCNHQERPVNVVDLGIFGVCLGEPSRCCDFNCDDLVTILDLGIWAGALLTSCP